MSDELKLSERVTIEFTGNYNDKARDPAYRWLDEWELEYRILREHYVNERDTPETDTHPHIGFDLLCTKAALEALPETVKRPDSEWTEKCIIIESKQDRAEERAQENADIPDTLSVPLKRPLNIQKEK